MQATMTKTTPSVVPIRQATPASRGSRLLAAFIDGAAVFLIYGIAVFIGHLEVLILGIAALWIYQIFLLTTLGQTIGKRFCGIKIVTHDTGANGGFVTNVLLRSILNGLISVIPFYALVDILFIFREDRRCIHDMIAGTKVVEA